jgi:hypothetical protein
MVFEKSLDENSGPSSQQETWKLSIVRTFSSDHRSFEAIRFQVKNIWKGLVEWLKW